MESDKKQISKNRVKITISVPASKVEEYFEAHYARLAPTVNLQGFRPGKAPRVMTIEAIGQARLANMTLEQAIDEAYREALQQHKTYPVTPPSVSISKHPTFEGTGEQNELKFEVEFDILPEAKVGAYQKIRIKKADQKRLEVTDEEVDKVVEYLRRQSADLKEKTGRAAKGDWVDISFKGSIKSVEKEKLTSLSLPMVIGETKMIPGFEEKLIDMKKGEKKEFKITFPKDFQDKEFAGQKAKFALELKDLREINLPELKDEFFTKFGLKTLKELRTNIQKSLIAEKQEHVRGEQVGQISQELMKITKVDIPKSLIANEKARMKSALTTDLSKQNLTLEKYIQNLKITEKKFEEDLEVQAKRNILLGVAIGEIAKKEKIEINSQEGTRRVFDYLIELATK